ncbi:UDP-N-acetylglucosamine 1-carboxyvinyltransferase [Vulcanimicrobium alpinum]|uniref:UDP-N-acetylglucosamine 1-carboxyvinyltransferase n=1 Tax=Vulcanimicrobium alpinum TaxID=3016050 RepID=A0AAN1XZD1_UNVUL|nr:UDP-N-acetylglucosamine 1-carboxyvinyltransferase [Vulcanimicrobium alpinum]BDE08149.1 UDP-N-acetylglucosamine 1-carboxyvinyltransferase [Vulcanimicrobium alpinum]
MNVLDRLDTTLRVVGGARLEGSVDVQGAKNAALPIMAASLLARGKVTLHRVPRITDVSVMWSLLEALGARVAMEDRNTLTIDAANVNKYRAPYTLVRKLAASFDLCGPLLGRFGRAEVPLPGGCVLGTRATDMHEAAFRALDAEVSVAHGYLIANGNDGRLHGGEIEFRTPSVGATKNAMLAAVTAEGDTLIRNAAMEPEVVDLANFLVAMGAKIAGQGGDTIRITGVRELHGVEYEIIPDRIAAGTLLIAGAITRGDVTVKKSRPDDLHALQFALSETGVTVTSGDDWVRVQADTVKGGTDVVTAPHPGFPTDLQPQLISFLCTAPGVSVVEESIFNARFSYINELVRMGADVRVARDNNTALVKGVAQLSGAPVEAPDIRAGAALVIAGLCAAGETEIIGLEYIDRGYERLEETLASLGGQVQRSSGIIPFNEPLGTFETSEYPSVQAAP